MPRSTLRETEAHPQLNTDIQVPGVGAYGLGIYEAPAGWFGRGGQTFGWESYVRCNPATGATCVGIANSTSGIGAVNPTCSGILGIG